MMKLTSEKLKALLVLPGHISADDLKAAEAEASVSARPLLEVIVEKNLIREEQLGRLIAEDLGIGLIDLKQEVIDENVLQVVPELVAASQGVVAISRSQEGIRLGMRDPADQEIRHQIEKRFGEAAVPLYITKSDFKSALTHYRESLTAAFEKSFQAFNNPKLTMIQRDALTIHTVDMLLGYAYTNKASDIHIEPYREKVTVRFRIDGVLHEILEIPKKFVDLIITRIKIMAKLRTDEHRAAQDGRFSFSVDKGADGVSEEIDIRVSLVPIGGGENVVMRLLSSEIRQFNLIDLGFLERDLKKINEAVKKPHGMILVTGPTGSGKTTTVYAILKILNRKEVHIATIEDPVEYDIEGVTQIQVNQKTNLTFAQGLRAIVRQDPDIIMVGEIRDEETADIAVNSAMTGHLVLTTLHANDAATTLPRLLEMKIEPFLAASTVNVAIAQRLVRAIHMKCRMSYVITAQERQLVENEPKLNSLFKNRAKDLSKLLLFRGQGCAICAGTGYAGRTAIFEVLEMSGKIKELIMKRASSDELAKAAEGEGMTTMLEDGVDKVLRGITTIAEVLRVTKA